MQELEYRLKKSRKKKRQNKDGKEGPENLTEQQERDEKEEQKISENQRAEFFVALRNGFFFHVNDLAD